LLDSNESFVPTLDAKSRAHLPDSAFAYVDSRGTRRLPINDASHVRNALARFEQVAFEDDAARERARERLLRAAKKYGIVPLGFFDGQIRTERLQTELRTRSGQAARLPRGTVTFLLTDIEGSTGLLEQLGRRYPTLLRDVRSIIRASVRKAGGHEVDARADEFFAVFRAAPDALDAAITIQRGMASHRWPASAEVCVRVGIHTGRPNLSESGYVGLAVHAAARICAAGHGGQILVSSATYATLDGAPEDISYRDLGRYTLSGIREPTTLYQARATGLRARFPRLRAALGHKKF